MKQYNERQLINAFTVDVEDAINQTMRKHFSDDLKPTERVNTNTRKLLDLLAEFNTKATFFILGEVAYEFPHLVREISDRGHELGIHGYSHKNYKLLSKKEIQEEIVRAKKIVEDISGKEVLGHRAPEFSIIPSNSWILEILINAGIKYDSSIFPAATSRYGWKDFKKDIAYLSVNGKSIIEAPLSSVKIIGKEVPACGGGYLRISPFILTDHFLKKIIKQRPANIYIHPYEIDSPPYPEYYMNAINSSSLTTRISIKKYWCNRTSVYNKLVKLLRKYKFDCLKNIINKELESNL